MKYFSFLNVLEGIFNAKLCCVIFRNWDPAPGLLSAKAPAARQGSCERLLHLRICPTERSSPESGSVPFSQVKLPWML